LPEPEDFPEFEYITGYGQPPEMQKFEREVIPVGLQELERSIRKELKPRNKARDLSPVRREIKVIERFWEELDGNQDKYAEEIEWLNLMWYYRLMGKFLFINGKATYITGGFWHLLNFWTFPNNTRPDYRDRDRRWSIGIKFCETCTTTFKDIDPDSGLPVMNAYGKYDMIDIARRTIFGPNYMKARRVGDTSKIENEFEEFSSRTISARIGIQGMSDENATTVFQEHLVQPFLKLPLFWKPIFDAAGGIAPKNTLLFDDLDNIDFGLHTIIDYATSADKSKYDGKFLHRFHADEFGKLQRSDPNTVIGVVKYCLSLGAGGNIHGLGAITTTCDEILDMSAGDNYMQFCNKSHYECRDANGQTETGFINIFFPAQDSLEGFIGPYGESIIDEPTPDQARFIGKTYGAMKFIENKIASYRRAKDWNGLALFRRQHPICFLDVFTPPPSQQVLRRDIVEDTLHFLKVHPEEVAVQGDFFRVGGILDGTVGWHPNPEGRFFMSRNFLPHETNRKIMRDRSWAPAVPDRFVGSPDTFGVSKPLGRKSNGGLVIRWRRDFINDPADKEMDLVESERDIITYSFRPPTVEEFAEDMLMAHIYVGAMCFPERNNMAVIDHFRRRGYENFLLYEHDRVTGKRRNEPGWWNHSSIVDEYIKVLADDVVKHGKRCKHPDLLEEYLKFGGRAYLTDCDLVAGKLGTLIAERNPYYQLVKGAMNHISVEGWIPYYKE